MTHFGFPYHMDRRGRTASATPDEHIRQLIEQVLFTAAGERVNRPDFGTGILQLVFAPNSAEVASAVQFLVQGSLQRWLGEWILVEDVEVTSEDSTLSVQVRYRQRQDQQQKTSTFRFEA